MKNYYCLIIIGNVEKVEDTLTKVIDGTFMHKNLGKIFISTFESNFSIWEIEDILHGDKRSYFITKMDGANFTATVQDNEIQNDLFLDYVKKMTKINDTPKPIDMDKIEEFFKNKIHPNENFDFNPKEFFKQKRNKKKKENVEPPTLDEILDKINRVGYEKLTKFEKKCLEDYSKNR